MAASPVNCKITYGVTPGGSAFEIGGTDSTATRVVHSSDGPFNISRTFNSFSIEFSFILMHPTKSALNDDIKLVETVFAQPRQDFKLEIGGNTQYEFKHEEATGFDSVATIIKRGDPIFDGSCTRSYRASISVELPADQMYQATGGNGGEGLRTSSVDVAFGANHKRMVNISGTYTALPASAAYTGTQTGSPYARTQYEDQIDDYCNSVLTALTTGESSAVFELIPESAVCKDTDLSSSGIGKGKVLQFTRQYEEIFFEQGDRTGEDFNDPAMKNQSFMLSLRKNEGGFQSQDAGNGPYAKQLVIADVAYQVSFDRKAYGEYPTVANLKGSWLTLRPWFIQKCKDVLQLRKVDADINRFFVLNETVTENLDDMSISVGMSIGAMVLGNPPLSMNSTYEVQRAYGRSLVPIWDRTTPYARYEFQGPATRQMTYTQNFRIYGTIDQAPFTEPNWRLWAPKGEGDWKFTVLSRQRSSTPLHMGVGDEDGEFSDHTATTVVEFWQEKVGNIRPVTFVRGKKKVQRLGGV